MKKSEKKESTAIKMIVDGKGYIPYWAFVYDTDADEVVSGPRIVFAAAPGDITIGPQVPDNYKLYVSKY